MSAETILGLCDFTPVERTVQVRDTSCSLSLARDLWVTLDDICHREGLTLDALATQAISRAKSPVSPEELEAQLAVYALSYFREAMSVEGRSLHRQARRR